ncbi:MAG: glucose-6-phosphate dehydrogenase [Acidobacteria bacterium]|nr:glucose-6-phosphate dehydrogenase [Acidobacteriota bacterium]MDA1236592.1 glucose-6-phosphate dehydrogenase [Acidobacteriota bacterium]
MADNDGQRAAPNAMAIFGASGDLTKRKLIPALYNLRQDGLLPDDFAIIGISRREMSDEEFREKLREDMAKFATVKTDPAIWDWLADRVHYMAGDAADPDTYRRLRERLEGFGKTAGIKNYFFYMATAPRFFGPVCEQLREAGLTQEEEVGGWRRVVFEKPFGHDLKSARELNQQLGRTLTEDQIYRIDHYLGKETVQNILVFRFANGIFEPLWNHRYIDHVQITVAESIGVGDRGGYYDKSGALRDMVPNHIFQLISLTCMEPPISFEAAAVRDEQAKVLRSLAPLSPEEALQLAVRGQYGPGTANGEKVEGYRGEPGVPRDSGTETFVAMKLTLDNWRWAGVPIYLRTGKCLPLRATEISIQFNKAPFTLFRKTEVSRLPSSRLVIRLQPDEGISLSFGAKVPGPILKLGQVDMNFQYEDYFGTTPSTGYERLLYDCMCGDQTLFQRADMTEASWKIVTPILDLWEALTPRNFPNYAAGTWGPKEADELLGRDGREWAGCGEC